MIAFTSSPRGGVGQPTATPRGHRSGDECSNDHRNPERAGDCGCGDFAAEREERAAAAAMETAGPCGGTLEWCDAVAQRAGSKGAGYACSLHGIYVRGRRGAGAFPTRTVRFEPTDLVRVAR